MFNLSVIVQRVSLAGLLFFACSCANAQKPISSSPPIAYEHVVRHDPNLSIYVVKIDLKDPRVSVHVSRGGHDPDGDGPWTTTLMPTSEVAQREGYDVAINGDFFEAKSTKDIEGRNTGYVRGKAASPVGMAMSDGVLWHRAASVRPYLEITASKIAKVMSAGPSDKMDADAREIVGAGQVIEQNGRAVTLTNRFAIVRNPRTAVGIDASGTQLTLLVVDGRQPNLSVGMTLNELGQEMVQLGCANSLNLDGGGSSTLVYLDPATRKRAVMNSPSDTKERSVADVLGVRLEK